MIEINFQDFIDNYFQEHTSTELLIFDRDNSDDQKISWDARWGLTLPGSRKVGTA
jgi:hypothetical protein